MIPRRCWTYSTTSIPSTATLTSRTLSPAPRPSRLCVVPPSLAIPKRYGASWRSLRAAVRSSMISPTLDTGPSRHWPIHPRACGPLTSRWRSANCCPNLTMSKSASAALICWSPWAQAYLAVAIRNADPVRARQLLESARGTYPGAALAPLSDMLIKGEGGPKNERRALSLLKGSAYDAQHAKWALGQLTLEGRLVPRDVAAAVKLLGPWSQWDYDTRLQIVRLLAENPDVQMAYPDHFIYRAIEDAELGEPGAMDALIALKLSRHVQFADKANGCVLAQRAAKDGDDTAAPRLDGCRTK